jgi:hypothetical protein
MKDTDAFNLFPKTQVKPFDGMSVTAEIWEQAHDEHRQALSAHSLVAHGSGIITGLEVAANDPPDHYVFISPGVAVDPAGNVIVVPEPVAYDFGSTAEGSLYLLLGRGEREVGGVGNEAKYLQAEFVIAARSSLPKRPAVELARVTLSKRGKAVKNADTPLHPGPDALDLRFRNQIGPVVPPRVRTLVITLGKKEPDVVNGWDYLERVCRQSASYDLLVDIDLPASNNLDAYDLVYVGGMENFSPEADLVKALTGYLKQGKFLLVEALDNGAQESCKDLLRKLKRNATPIDGKSPLLTAPFLFATPPAGFSGNQVEVGKQVVYSAAGYSLAWSGRSASGVSSRSDIRSAHEWGTNLIYYCMEKAKA